MNKGEISGYSRDSMVRALPAHLHNSPTDKAFIFINKITNKTDHLD